MAKNKHDGGSFDDFLKEQGIYEEVTALAKAKAKYAKSTKNVEDPTLVKYRHRYSIMHDAAQSLSETAAECVRTEDYKKAARLFGLAAKYEAKALDCCRLKFVRTRQIIESSREALEFKAKKYAALAKPKPKKKKPKKS